MCVRASLGMRYGNQGNSLYRKLTRIRSPIIGRQSAVIAVDVGTVEGLQQIPRADKLVGGWLITCSGMVFGAVLLGGITRLTKSGLSMVDWHPLNEGRPRTEAEWEAEFAKYQQFPEFKIRNKDMTMEQFKSIYWMEYIHRMWGRSIGAVFYIPAAVFWMIGYLRKGMKQRIVYCGALLAAQGLMGWYMVRSGLEEKHPDAHDTTPRVSNLRLAAHLGTAFVLYSLLLRTGFDHILPAQRLAYNESLVRFSRFGHLAMGLVFCTALSGALVAGIEAGLVYNSFPKMADRWIPSDILALEPKWKNFFENATTVQFDHRLLGEMVFFFLTALYIHSRKVPLPPRARLATHTMLAAAWLQVGLGITTLLTYVPTPIAVSHQAGALTLLTTLLWVTHELKLIQRLPK
ncbi:cytochrome c oxidase assembly protein COX15-like [Tropilaelaps mercedesae]|uniref:Cytochrome c oxidase assembly protein COX15-like n=1 Tax=Tropilaelaps mercedesae TaxID=418985 RepID=A0A1V9Y0Z4_9ACAR|nr:cytochrome c oxidase assembly protein COX15-like [Tropilaelaps mercedesae]